jgi:hypothetical protein
MSLTDGGDSNAHQPKPAASEQRVQKRFACQGFAEVILDGAAFLFRGTICDLSLSGCYVESRARLLLDRGTNVELRFAVAGDELVVPAEIVGIRRGHGAGFQFLELGAEKQGRLSTLIHRLANPTAQGNVGPRTGAAEDGPKSAGESRDLWHGK